MKVLELQKIIQELLVNNDFVSLPGLGSFAQNYHPAKLQPDGKTFSPPKQVISFDTTRLFNDEAIEQHLQQELNISHEKAVEMVKVFVDEVKQSLDKGYSIHFDKVGDLKRSDSGSIVLQEVDDNEKVSSTFGLQTVDAKELEPKVVEQPKITQKPPVEKVPQKTTVVRAKPTARSSETSSIKWVIGAVAAIAVVAILASGTFFLVPELQFWKEVEKPQLTQAQISDKELEATVETEQIYKKTETDDLQDAYLDDPMKTDKPEEEPSVSVLAIDTDKRSALLYEEPTRQDFSSYYIIVGSYEKMENAQIHFNNLKGQGHSPEIIKSNGRYRVSLSKFSDRNRALRELERLRREKPTESVWLLGL